MIDEHGGMGMRLIRFGTDGWRDVMCDNFTFSNVRRVCRAIARHIKDRNEAELGVVVARDARFMGEQFARQAGLVLLSEGIPVFMVEGDAPTPLVALAAMKNRAGAVLFTASHNPPEYNGIKFIPGYGGPATEDITKAIEKNLDLVGDQPAEADFDRVQVIDVDEEYEKQVLALIDAENIHRAGLRVVYDSMYGSGRRNMPNLLGKLGVQTSLLHNQRDALFGGRTPEPILPHLPELLGLIKSGKADLGLATDGDADRFGVVDSTGEYVTPNEVLVLLAYHLIKNRKQTGVLVRTVATTHMLDRLALHYGLECLETPVGFKYISAIMRERKMVIGGEESGGLSIGGHIPEKDGILANLLITELRAVEGRSLKAIWQEIAQIIGSSYNRRVDLRLPEEAKLKVLNILKEKPPQMMGRRSLKECSCLDGVKYIFSDKSWMLTRASGTEPLLRIYLEASDQNSLKGLAADALQYLESLY
jgi:phosphomannomutase